MPNTLLYVVARTLTEGATVRERERERERKREGIAGRRGGERERVIEADKENLPIV